MPPDNPTTALEIAGKVLLNPWVIFAVLMSCSTVALLVWAIFEKVSKFPTVENVDSKVALVANTQEANYGECLRQIRDLRRDYNDLVKLLTLSNEGHRDHVSQSLGNMFGKLDEMAKVVSANAVEVGNLKGAIDRLPQAS